MAFQERNTVASLTVSSLLLAFFGPRITTMLLNDAFLAENLFQLWLIVIVGMILGTIAVTILANIVHGAVYMASTQQEPDSLEYEEDERDQLIELKGTRVAYVVFSFGVFFAMLSFVINQSPLPMFALLIASGLVAQMVGNVSRLFRYRAGA
ncbi:MAG: hypothetical protein GYB68_05590 [Chloroflexi bacterium]|nr:hypothetical protein [Chloroflexota bacterium]